jgi:hypothetical protein
MTARSTSIKIYLQAGCPRNESKKKQKCDIKNSKLLKRNKLKFSVRYLRLCSSYYLGEVLENCADKNLHYNLRLWLEILNISNNFLFFLLLLVLWSNLFLLREAWKLLSGCKTFLIQFLQSFESGLWWNKLDWNFKWFL